MTSLEGVNVDKFPLGGTVCWRRYRGVELKSQNKTVADDPGMQGAWVIKEADFRLPVS